MAQTQAKSGDFIANLGRIYGMYTGGFFAFVILLGILEQVGVPNRIIGYLFVFFTLLVYAGIGILSRTMQVSEYYVAGRRVPAIYNGMATGADWMSGASFVGMAGTLYMLGYDGLAFVLGWTGGYVLVAVLLAPYLRKYAVLILSGLALVVVANAFALTPPYLIKRAIDDLNGPAPGEGILIRYALFIVGAALMGGAARYGMRELLNGVSRRVEFDLYYSA